MNADEAVSRGAALQCAILSPLFKVFQGRCFTDGGYYDGDWKDGEKHGKIPEYCESIQKGKIPENWKMLGDKEIKDPAQSKPTEWAGGRGGRRRRGCWTRRPAT